MTMDAEPSALRRHIIGQLRVLELQLEELDIVGRARRRTINAEVKALRERLADLGADEPPMVDP